MSDDTEPCDGCERTRDVTWSHAFAAWLCQQCLHWRTEKLLGPTPNRWSRPVLPAAEPVTGAHP